ncbi:tape measure protein [Acinetobacter sp. ULE_I092]|uniref:tape measure protein n=1 Tax=Acinetobacter sp. ULE_I092 TaxID=3373075 RepID=UPI003AF79CF2
MAEQRSTLIIEISSEQAARNARALDRELQSIERTGNYATTSMNSMSVAARQLAGYLAGVVTVGTAIAKMDDWTNLNNRLRLVTTSQKALNVAMQDTFDIAQRSGAAWGGTATIYQKIQYNSEKLGLSQEKVAKITESISKSISNSGSSAQAASAALYQLGQSFDKSSLNGDEFVSMSENAGYLMEVFAKGLGVTRAELKEMSSQGLLTTDKMVQAIEKMSGSIEEDFGKTNFTIGQSFTQLSNAVTKFVGESGQATGAASAISSSLSSLAENLNTVTNIAMIGGAYWVGTYIPALYTSTMAGYGKIKQLVEQTVIQYAAVQAEKVAAAQELAGAEAKLVNLQATRAQLVEELKLELARKKKQISDQGAINSELRMGLLRQQQAAINVELTATENALAAARTRSAAAATATLGIGSRILGVMTGPVGIGISIAAVAAGYLLMRDSTAEANKKLEEQTEIASRTKQELLALQGVQKKGAKTDLQEAFKGQNKELKDLNYLFNAHIIELQNAYRGNLQIVEISNKVRQGIMSQEEALKELNKLDFISPDQLKQLQKDNDLYREKLPVVQRVQEALKVFGIDAELAGNKATNASKGVNDIAKEAITTSEKVKGLSEEIQKFISSSLSSSLQNEERLKLYNQGLSKESADIILKAREAAGIVGTDQQLPLGTLAILGRELLTTTEIKKVEDERNKSEKDRTKEMEAQQKLQAKQAVLLAGNNEQTRNMLRVYQSFRNAGLGDKQARVMTAQVGRENDFRNSDMFGSHKDANNGYTNTGFISWQKGRSTQLMQFLQGQGVLDKNGKIQQTQDALDAMAKFLMQEIATGKSYGKTKNALNDDNLSYRELEKIVGQNFIGWDYNGRKLGKDKASQHLSKQDNYFNQISKILGANPENVMSSIKDLSKFDDEAFKARAKTEEEIKQLQAKYDTEAIQRSKARDEEITQATILGQTQLLPKIKERYNAQDKLAKLQQDYELNGYKYTEDQKLIYQRDSAKEQLDAEGKYSDEVKALHKKSIDDLYDYEVVKSKLAKDQRLLQATEFYMSELQLAKAKYDIERRLLEQSNDDPADKAFKSQMLALQNHVDMNRRLKDASTGWDTVQAQMNGSTGRYQVNQDKFSRMGASQNLFDTQMADVENQEQEPGADLQKLAEVREQIWAAHNQRMIDIENQYQTDSLNLQLTQAQQLTGSFANMFKGILGESSGAYKTMFAMQQGFALAQAGMNLWSSVSDAYAKEPGTVWQKVAAGAKAALDQGTFLAMIQAITPQGFATGGHITGKGTGTSDDIPIMASNGEFMLKAAAVSKLGLAALNYMNQTGEIPDHSKYMSMKSPSTKSDSSTQKFKDGGLVGGTRMSNEDGDRRRFNSIPKNSSQGEGSGDIKIEVNITDSGVNTSGGNTQDQRQFAQVVGNAVRAVIIQEKRQGGLLSK